LDYNPNIQRFFYERSEFANKIRKSHLALGIFSYSETAPNQQTKVPPLACTISVILPQIPHL